MSDITKIKVDGEPESSYKLFPKNREFEKRAGGNGDSQSGVQPDWNQNDETAPDYVKNRPFYTGNPVETVLVEESTIQFTDIGGGLFTAAIESTFSPTVGNAYKISWDGTDYESACVKVGRSTYIGNLSIDGSGPDTGEPFLIQVVNQVIDVATLDDTSYHTISIGQMVDVTMTIDEKYIPAVLPYLSKENPTGTGSFSLNRKADTEVGDYSFAEGDSTTASGRSSHAEGDSTTASNRSSHAEGIYTIASGVSSHSEGHGTKASSANQHVQGKYNIEDSSNTYAHIVGNGTEDARSNAHTLDWSGNAWFAGTIEGKAFILPSSTEGSTKRFKITVDDSGALTATEVT